MEQQIYRFDVRILGGGEAAPHEIACQINLFDKYDETIGYLKFLNDEDEQREHQCHSKQVTVWYRQSQFDSVLKTLQGGGRNVVFCNGVKDSGIRSVTR